MRSDNALLLLIKSEIARGVLSGNLRMMVAMQLVSVRMPVIQEIIMQKCGAYESSLIASRMKRTVQCECGFRYAQTVAVSGHISVLNIFFSSAVPSDPARSAGSVFRTASLLYL